MVPQPGGNVSLSSLPHKMRMSLLTIKLAICSVMIQQMINFIPLAFSQVQIPRCLHLEVLSYVSAALSALDMVE